MVTITADAIAKAEQFIANAGPEPMDWFIIVSWRKSVADNRRTADGAVVWKISRDEGWVAEIGGWAPGRVPREETTPLFGEVRLLVQNHRAPAPFPGGEICVKDGEFKVRGHAI